MKKIINFTKTLQNTKEKTYSEKNANFYNKKVSKSSKKEKELFGLLLALQKECNLRNMIFIFYVAHKKINVTKC